jgi:hypothetical protein
MDEPLTIQQAIDNIGLITENIALIDAARGKEQQQLIRAQKSLLGAIARGDSVPGYKAVEYKGDLEWANDDEKTLQLLVDRIKASKPKEANDPNFLLTIMFKVMELKSPTGVAKVIPKSLLEGLTKQKITLALREIE